MANTSLAKGSASLSINSQETEAKLVFTPDPNGDGWDLAAVLKLAADKQIKSHADDKNIQGFLDKAAKAKTTEPMEMVLSQGLEPEPPQNEKIKWEALPVPGDMAGFQTEVLANAKAPVIFRIKVDKIKHEKTVVKPGALPFLHGKEETVVEYEKKETREKVDVDTDVIEVKYADRGAKLGVLTPPVPGKPGKSILGRPIPPPAPEGDSAFLFGEGINREKNDAIAQISGLVRIGDNWADMVPFAKPAYLISTGVDGVTPFLNFAPGDPRFAPPKAEDILAAAVAKGAPAGNLVDAKELDDAIASAIKMHEPLESFALMRIQEAEARVDINPDKTKAVLYLRKGVAGAMPLETKAISQAIKESEVHGFDPEKLKTMIHTFMDGKDLELKDYVLAEGVASTRGKDREIKIESALLKEEEQKPILDRLNEWDGINVLESEEIDLSKATGYALVKKGKVVAKVSADSEGEAGKDIYGNVIPGIPGNDPDIKLYRGLELRGSDIVATQDGLLVMEAAEKSFWGSVIDYKDARVDVHISQDAMEASGDFYCEEGPGLPLTVENVEKILTAQGITKGINWEGIEKICAQARTKKSVLAYFFARGELPVAKGGAALTWLLDRPPGLSSLELVSVKAGAPIVDLSEPVADGKPGYDIKGNEIPIEHGAVVIEHDDSIKEEKHGAGKRYTAVRPGELIFDGKSLKISSVKVIEGDLNPEGGPLKFSGEIQIKGNVLSSCTVIGESHITVSGMVEAAIISAGGKVAANLGLKGGGKGIIRARTGIQTAFVERGSVMAVGNIKLTKGSLQSIIKTNGNLVISAEDGKLAGGVCQTRHGIDAADVGSEKGIHTEISFGQDYIIKDQIGVCEETIVKHKRELFEAEEKIKSLVAKKQPLPDDLKEVKIKLVKLLEQLNLKVFTLREKFEEHYESVVQVRGTIFPGVVIESHGRYYEVKQKRSRVIFYFDKKFGSIKEKPME